MLVQVLNVVRAEGACLRGTPSGAELGVMLLGDKRYGVELNWGEGPTITKSPRIALDDLKLERARMLYPGAANHPQQERVRVCLLKHLRERVAAWRPAPYPLEDAPDFSRRPAGWPPGPGRRPERLHTIRWADHRGRRRR